MQKRLMATVVFSGELDPDPAAAAAALRKAGYEVVTMPEKFRKPLELMVPTPAVKSGVNGPTIDRISRDIAAKNSPATSVASFNSAGES